MSSTSFKRENKKNFFLTFLRTKLTSIFWVKLFQSSHDDIHTGISTYNYRLTRNHRVVVMRTATMTWHWITVKSFPRYYHPSLQTGKPRLREAVTWPRSQSWSAGAGPSHDLCVSVHTGLLHAACAADAPRVQRSGPWWLGRRGRSGNLSAAPAPTRGPVTLGPCLTSPWNTLLHIHSGKMGK